MDLWVGTEHGLHRLGDTAGDELDGVAVTALDVHGADRWCVADGKELLRREDRGWVRVARVGDDDELRCVRETASGVLVGTAEGHLLRLSGTELELVEAFEQVEGRDRWWNVGGSLGEHGNVRSLSEAPDGTLYVNVHVGGIYRSSDGGSSWATTVDQEADVHEVLALEGGRLLAATGSNGFMYSNDEGRTWASVTDGLPADGWGGYTRAVTVCDDGRTVLVTGSRGAFSDLDGGVLAGVYRWTPGAAELERCTRGLPAGFAANIDTGQLAAAVGVAAFGAGDAVYVSGDAGLSWSVVAEGLPRITTVAALP